MSSSVAMLLSFALLAVLVARWVLARFVVRLASYERHADAFFSSARPLLRDPETPDSVLEMLSFMAREIGRRRAAIAFLGSILRLHRNGLEYRKQGEDDDIERVFFERRPELDLAYGRACAAGMLAVTYRSALVGAFVRRLVLFDIESDNRRAERLASRLNRYEKAAPLGVAC